MCYLGNITKILENNTWNLTKLQPPLLGDGHFCYCRHVYFNCDCIYVHTLD